MKVQSCRPIGYGHPSFTAHARNEPLFHKMRPRRFLHPPATSSVLSRIVIDGSRICISLSCLDLHLGASAFVAPHFVSSILFHVIDVTLHFLSRVSSFVSDLNGLSTVVGIIE